MAKEKMKVADWVAITLILVGAFHLGLSGFGVDVVSKVFGNGSIAWKITHWVIGAAGGYSIYSLFKNRK